MYQTLEYSREKAIALVRLNRPEKLNAINREMVAEIGDVVRRVHADEGLRALVFTGNGRAFSAGADISHLVELAGPPDFLSFIEEIQTTFNALEDLNRPTIAAVNGIAFGGGCELVLACDFRILAAAAALGVPEIKIGVLPGAGGTQRLSRMLPQGVAKQMIYLGEPLSAPFCLHHGLVNSVVPDEKVLETAFEWAHKLAQLPPLAIRSAKLLVHGAANRGLREGIEAERQALAFLFGTADRTEGMRAFLEKRQPTFTGR
jgi:enoyl-CoA hydratase/carnithine racemase